MASAKAIDFNRKCVLCWLTFCLHLSDLYVDQSYIYVALSNLYVNLSDFCVDWSHIHLFENESKYIKTRFCPVNVIQIHVTAKLFEQSK